MWLLELYIYYNIKPVLCACYLRMACDGSVHRTAVTLQALASLISTLFVPVQSGSLIIVVPFHHCQDVAHCKGGDSVEIELTDDICQPCYLRRVLGGLLGIILLLVP